MLVFNRSDYVNIRIRRVLTAALVSFGMLYKFVFWLILVLMSVK